MKLYERQQLLLNFKNVLEILSSLSKGELLFLKETYCKGGSGQMPFDYVGIDEAGHKYFIDVTSTKSGIIAPFSKREKTISKQATKLGFKIVRPVVRFLSDWWVEVRLEEI